MSINHLMSADEQSGMKLSGAPRSVPAQSIHAFASDAMETKNCPCVLDRQCGEECCVQTLRVAHSQQLAKADRNNSKFNEEKAFLASYGSLDSLNGQIMVSPVHGNSPPRELEGSEDMATEPLLRDMLVQSPSGGPVLTVRAPSSPSLEQSVLCECHVKAVDHTTRRAVIKLLLASFIALLFMIGEVLGGYFANSLAIMTDAAHMLSDFAGFLISLFAIWISRRPPSRGMSFGWHRAEVIGALVSVLIIWIITGVLFYEAVLRVVHRNFEVNSEIMLITACVGVFVNVFMCMVLHQHSHGHGGHGHATKRRAIDSKDARQRKKKSSENINVRAAFIHVIGDLIQSIGVVIAGYIIWIWPSLKLADPICTFLFCLLVLFSTFNILKDALRVVMEGTPKHIDYEVVKADLTAVPGVRQAHSLHIWSLTLNRTALAAHLVLEPGADSDEVLSLAGQLLKQQHHITQTTLQVERHHDLMDDCSTCQESERTGVLHGLLPNFLKKKKAPRTRV